MRPLFGWASALAAAALIGCPGGPIAPTYENVARIVDRSCAFSDSCHGGAGRGEATLNFALARDDITAVLNGVPACEYDLMPRVDPGNPDNSWILVKIDGVYNDRLEVVFEPDPSWMPDTTHPVCPLEIEPPYDFGMRMPDTGPQLPENERTAIREWIMLGAPGPT